MLVGIWLAACAQPRHERGPSPSEGGDDTAAPTEIPGSDEDVLALTDAFLEAQMRVARVPGLAVSIVRGDETIFAQGYGFANVETATPVSPDTPFMLASVSKTFICAQVLQARDLAAFDLDEDVDGLLPFPIDPTDHPDTPVTTRELLTHTSSINDYWPVWRDLYADGDSTIPLETFLEGFLVDGGEYWTDGKSYNAWAPGTKYEYSNVGAATAALVVEATTGQDFAERSAETLFAPLGMTHTGWHLADFAEPDSVAMPYTTEDGVTFVPFGQYGYPDYPDGALRSSAHDVATFLRVWLSGGQTAGTRVLEETSVDEALTDQLGRYWEQGLVWYADDRAPGHLWGHSGSDSGVSTQVSFRLDDGIGVVILMNGDWYDDSAVEAIETWLYVLADVL
jgi:CubicO group peptidase (beta-lactamase class C family)